MPTPTESAPPPARVRVCLWLRLGVMVFVLAMVAWRWDARTGFTALIRFGDDFSGHRVLFVGDEHRGAAVQRGT